MAIRTYGTNAEEAQTWWLARRLAAAGASLVVSDIDTSKHGLAAGLGADWLPPEELLRAQADVLVPASLGGLLMPELVDRLRCAAVVGRRTTNSPRRTWPTRSRRAAFCGHPMSS